jgi:hypothetical protein
MKSARLRSLAPCSLSLSRPRNSSYFNQTRYVLTTSVSQESAISLILPSRKYGSTSAPLPHDVERGCDVAGRLETALRTCLADRPGSEDEVRPEERANTGSRDVSRLKIENDGSPGRKGNETRRLWHPPLEDAADMSRWR